MALGRTHIVAPLGATDTERKMVNRTNVALRALDRRKPIATPSVFRDDASRPAAEANPGRIIFVQQADGTVRGQYSDGQSWQTFLATAVSYATPTITYGTTYSAGALNTTIRSDAQLKFPTAIMSSANSATMTLTDDASNTFLTGSIGNSNYVAASGGSHVLDTNATTSPAIVCSVVIRANVGARTGLRPSIISSNLSSTTLQCWDASMSAFAGVLTGSTLVAYDVSNFSVTPSATSDDANKLYGIRIASGNFQINNSTGGWSEVATAYFQGVQRSISSPEIDVQATVIVEPPTAASTKTDDATATDQIGIYIRQQTAQTTATNRIALKIDAQNSGTNKYAIHAITDQSYLGPINQDDNVKHRFGTGLDGTIYYDATNLIIDPDEVGTGVVNIGATGDDDMHLTNIEIDGALNHDGTTVGFYNTAPTTQLTVTGSRGGNAALASLLTQLATTGIIVDGTSA